MQNILSSLWSLLGNLKTISLSSIFILITRLSLKKYFIFLSWVLRRINFVIAGFFHNWWHLEPFLCRSSIWLKIISNTLILSDNVLLRLLLVSLIILQNRVEFLQTFSNCHIYCRTIEILEFSIGALVYCFGCEIFYH